MYNKNLGRGYSTTHVRPSLLTHLVFCSVSGSPTVSKSPTCSSAEFGCNSLIDSMHDKWIYYSRSGLLPKFSGILALFPNTVLLFPNYAHLFLDYYSHKYVGIILPTLIRVHSCSNIPARDGTRY